MQKTIRPKQIKTNNQTKHTSKKPPPTTTINTCTCTNNGTNCSLWIWTEKEVCKIRQVKKIKRIKS